MEWFNNYGARNSESSEDILAYSTDEIMLWGYNQPRTPFYNLQSILVKTNGEGELTRTKDDVIETKGLKAFAFPNPVTDELHLILSPEIKAVVPWIIEDISGRILLSGKGYASPSLHIDLHSLQPGLYFIAFPGTEYPGCRIIVVNSN